MTPSQPEQIAVPTWVRNLHKAALHGTPDSAVREATLALWNSHAAELFADPSSRGLSRAAKIIGSAAGHALWRLVRGPATTVSTGFLVGLVGIASAAFFAKDLGALAASKNGLTSVGLLLFGYVLVRYPSRPPARTTLAAFAMLIPSAVWTIWEYMTDPQIPTERLAAAGAMLCVFGAFEFSRSAQQHDRLIRARAWRLFAIGIGAFAVANLIGATQYESADVRTTAAIASWIEALLAASLLRVARAESASRESADAILTKAVTP